MYVIFVNYPFSWITGETSATPTEEKHMDRSIVGSDYFQLKHIQEKETKCVDVGVQLTRDRNKKIRTYDTSGRFLTLLFLLLLPSDHHLHEPEITNTMCLIRFPLVSSMGSCIVFVCCQSP